MIQLTDSQEATFWAHFHLAGSCWLWSGPTDRWGYGIYYFDGQQYLASRVAYWLHMHRECDDGMPLVPVCGSRICCQPQHLRVR